MDRARLLVVVLLQLFRCDYHLFTRVVGKRLKRGLCKVALFRLVRAKVALRFVDQFRYAGMSQELTKVVLTCFKAERTDLRGILSLTGQRAFLRFFGSDVANTLPKKMDEEENYWRFEVRSLP